VRSSQQTAWQTGALIDFALDDPRGLESVVDLKLAKGVVRSLALHLKTADLLERINGSLYAGELLAYLPNVFGCTKDALQPVVDILVAEELGKWDDCDLRKFSDAYWQILVGERLSRKDTRRAWDETKKAYRGLRPMTFDNLIDAMKEPPLHGLPQELAASRRHCADCIKAVYAALYQDNLVKLVSNDPLTRDELLVWADRVQRHDPIPGELFARAFAEKNLFGTISQMIIAIAGHFSAERNARRKRNIERAAAKQPQQ